MSGLRPLEHVPPLALPRRDPGRWRRWTDLLLDLVFPPFCPVCAARLDEGRRDPLCGTCWSAIGRLEPPWCDDVGGAGPDYARAAARYEGVVREALHAFKFRGRRALAAPLGDLLIEVVTGRLPAGAPDLLLPVPLHPRRERERGFNQAALLARRVGRAWGCPVREGVLVRTRATASQTELDAPARRDNVRAAFRVRRPAVVAGRHVVVVDDVLTTGATLAECARCLREAGARRVGVLTVARVV